MSSLPRTLLTALCHPLPASPAFTHPVVAAKKKQNKKKRKSLEAYWKMFAGAPNYSVVARNSVAEIVRRFAGLSLTGDGFN